MFETGRKILWQCEISLVSFVADDIFVTSRGIFPFDLEHTSSDQNQPLLVLIVTRLVCAYCLLNLLSIFSDQVSLVCHSLF